MKKVVFIINSLGTGGINSSLSSLYDTLKGKFDIKVLLLSTSGESKVSFSEVIIKPSFLCNGYYSDFGDAKGFAKIRAFISRIVALFNKNFEQKMVFEYNELFSKADCVIAFCEGKCTEFSKYIKHSNKIAWIHYDISYYPFDSRLTDLYSSFRKVFCVAEAIADGMKIKYPMLDNKIDSIHNLLDYERIRELSKSLLDDNIENCINIVSVGRIVPLKRFSAIPSIAKVLNENGIKFKWRILGPAIDNMELARLLEGIKTYNLEGSVEWLGPKNNPYPYIAKSDILVCLSETEACPMIFAEARILDTLIVTTNFKTSYEFVDNNIDGCISSFEMIPSTLLQLITDKLYYQTISNGSKNRADERDGVFAKFSEIIDYTSGK